MSTAQRVREPVAEKDRADWTESAAKLFAAGVGRMAEVQKKSIDIAVLQHTELVDFWKKAVQRVPGAPGLFLLDLEQTGLDRYAEIHKAAIDLVADQSKEFADLIKERTDKTTPVNQEVGKFTRKTVERVIAMQKKTLDQSALQARDMVESSRKQFGEDSPLGAAADSMQRGLDAIVDAQKELLDVAVR